MLPQHTSSTGGLRNDGVRRVRAVASSALVAALCATPVVLAQGYDRYNQWDRYDRNGRYDAYTRLAQIEPGTFVTVRTLDPIDTDRRDGRIFMAVVDRDVWDDYARLAIPAIPRGSPAELRVRSAPDGDLVLDLESVTVEGQRYAVSARPDRLERGRVESGDRTAEYLGGGAVLGTIIGAIAGGGKGAAIGAVAGTGAGAAGLMVMRGRAVRVPAGSLLTFRLEQGLSVGVPDDGYRRDRWDDHRN